MLSGSSSRGRDTFFCFAKRKYPKKRRPGIRALRVPCASRLKRRLRNSRPLAAQTVLADTPASTCDARRSSREPVRGGASFCAAFCRLFGGQRAAHPTQAGQAQVIAHQWIGPVGQAEHRRKLRGSRRGLFEQQTAGLMRVPQPPQLLRSAGHPQPQAEGVTSGSPSLGYLSWRDKKGTVPAGHPRHLITRVSAQNTMARHA